MATNLIVNIDAVAHIDPSRLKYATEQLAAEYSEVMSYFLAISDWVTLKFSSLPNDRSLDATHQSVSARYELTGVKIGAEEVQDFLDRLVWTRLGVSKDRGSLAVEHLDRALVRRIHFIQVGSLLVSGSNLELLTPEAVITEHAAGTNVPLHQLGKSTGISPLLQVAQQHVQSDHLFRKAKKAAMQGIKAYLAPAVLASAARAQWMNWHHVLASLARYPGLVSIRCREDAPNAADRAYSIKAIEAIRLTYASLLPEEGIARLVNIHLATVAPAQQFRVQIEFSSSNEVSLASAMHRDLDPDRLMLANKGTEGARHDVPADAISAATLTRLEETWQREELPLLLSPPYTMRHALASLPHYRPHPFRMLKNEMIAGLGVNLGTVQGGTALTLSLPNLCRHILVTGGSGSGKTVTMKRIVGEVLEANPQVNVLAIDPAKREYRDLVALYGFRLVDAGIFRFNPFVCPRTVRVYDHCDTVAQALTLLFPASSTSAAFILQMVRHAYLVRHKAVYGAYDNEALFRLTGEDLLDNSNLVPTFREFMELGLPYLNWVNQQSKSEWMGEFIGYFTNRKEHMRKSLFAYLTNPLLPDGNPDRLRSIDELFEGRCLLETGRLADTEANSLIAFLVSAFHSKLMSEDLKNDHPMHIPKPLRHVITLDEAHRVLPAITTDRSANISDPTEIVSKKLSIAIAELRSAGVAVVLGEQSPSKISDAALINTASKIIHRTTNGRDRQMLAGALGLRDDEAESLAVLVGRQAVVISPELYEPVLAELAVPHGFFDPRSTHAQRRGAGQLRLSIFLIGDFSAVPKAVFCWEIDAMRRHLWKSGEWVVDLVVGGVVERLEESFNEDAGVASSLSDVPFSQGVDSESMPDRFERGKVVAVVAGERISAAKHNLKQLWQLLRRAKASTFLLTFDQNATKQIGELFDSVSDVGKLSPISLSQGFEELIQNVLTGGGKEL